MYVDELYYVMIFYAPFFEPLIINVLVKIWLLRVSARIAK